MSDTPDGAILQRDKKTYAIVPRTPVGMLTAEILERITHVVKKFNIPITKITSGQRLALVGIEKEQIEPIWQELGLDIGRATELCLHYVQACPGTEVCKFGVQNSLGLGTEIEEMLRNDPTPAKVKIGVSGCPMCCAESFVRDIGLVGKQKGWTVAIGGHAGARPRIGDTIAENLSKSEAIALIKKFLAYYTANARKKERTARFIERIGIDAVQQGLGLS
ncbi:MAG: NAD(P)/FAD-dependent oxidoreductase [Proteobacteria bacterium]|nr:NAD(P)/FAD-dependent oxidoreductase [Pseudomonadota bacterium]MBU1714680.1 NAD(P)/FAD-dependent oxidoreductase [Pseudomonadota bacterium]